MQVLAVGLAAEVQGEEGPFGVAAQGAAEGLLARAHHVLARVLAAETDKRDTRHHLASVQLLRISKVHLTHHPFCFWLDLKSENTERRKQTFQRVPSVTTLIKL